jgi:hypothetical protein
VALGGVAGDTISFFLGRSGITLFSEKSRLFKKEYMDKHLDKNKGMQACHPLFKGTKWCVRFQDYFNEYAKSGPLYLIRDNGRPLILGHKNSEWLDTEDDPPNPTLMEKLSPFILNAGIASVAIKTVAYLPNPIQDTEAYIQSGKYKRQTATAMRAHLTGSDYEYENGVCVLADFGNLQETLEGLRNLGQNRINVDLDSIESRVEEAVSEQPTDLQDLVDSLDSQNKDRIIDILNKRYSEGYYGEIDGWDSYYKFRFSRQIRRGSIIISKCGEK